MANEIEILADLNEAQRQAVETVEIVDIWTFARDSRSRDPNWQLVATRSPN